MSTKSTAPNRQPHVLVVDDEPDIRDLIEFSLLRMGLRCDSAADLAEARQRLARGEYDLCLTDMRLPDGDGLELVAEIVNTHPHLPVAVISAHGNMETAIRALKLGAFDFVSKPVDHQNLREIVQHALRVDVQVDASTVTGASRREFIGRSAAAQALRTQIAKLARSQAPVFIHGESGTGKEVIARLIHESGPRAHAPFVPVNCGAISPELMESEFFGHKKGSFTGANTDKQGLFQAAHGGTLFLDEVSELPLPMQVKLLRAIQERAVRPVGGSAEEMVDVRILSASHRDLAEMVAGGRFRQDLYFRVNVITLNAPALRDRVEDIPDLCQHILARLAARDGTPLRRLSPSALAELRRQHFPGNVRQLENMLERACALCDGLEITELDIAPDATETLTQTSIRFDSIGAEPDALVTDSDADEYEKVLRTLDETRWNRSEAARRLGMTLRQLRYRLQKWGMD